MPRVFSIASSTLAPALTVGLFILEILAKKWNGIPGAMYASDAAAGIRRRGYFRKIWFIGTGFFSEPICARLVARGICSPRIAEAISIPESG
jgi:hypothetical protein